MPPQGPPIKRRPQPQKRKRPAGIVRRGPQGLPYVAPRPKPPFVLQGPGDAPQTRAADTRRANAYKRTPQYQGRLAGAQRIAQKRALVAAMQASIPTQKAKARTGGGLHIPIPVSALHGALKIAGAVIPAVGRPLRAVEKAVGPELAGVGQIAKGAAGAAKWVGEHGVGISTGGGPATLTARGGGSLAAATPYRVKDAPIVRRTVEDLVNFPAQAIPSLYVPAAGAVEAAAGRPQRIKQFGSDVKKNDPVLALVTGHPGKALSLAGQHPGFAALEVAGVKGVVGRAIGRVVKPKPLTPRVVPGTSMVQERPASPDAIKAARQHAVERHQLQRTATLRQKAAAADQAGHHDVAAALNEKANRIDPARMRSPEIRKRVDERVAVNETIRRQNRAQATAQAQRAVTTTQTPRGGPRSRLTTIRLNRQTRTKPSAATVLATQSIAKADPVALRGYVADLEQQAQGLTGSKLRANRELRSQITKAVDQGNLRGASQAARRYQSEVMGPRQRQLVDRGLLNADQAGRAVVIPYAVRNMGAKFEKAHYVSHDGTRVSNAELRQLRETHGDQMVRSLVRRVPDRVARADGSTLPTAEIRAHMREHGYQDPAYVTQAPSMRGSRNFFRNATQAPSVGKAARTGEATRQGTMSAHPDVLVEGAARAQGLIDAADGWKGFIHEVGVRKANGDLHTEPTKALADGLARDLSQPGGTQYRAVRENPFTGSKEQMQALLDQSNHNPAEGRRLGQHHPLRDAVDAALKGHDGQGPWGVIPDAAADQLAKHNRLLGATDTQKAFQAATSAFRRTVLATSPSWAAGNVTEGGMRAGLVRAGVGSYLHGRGSIRALQAIDAKAAQELAARATGGGHFNMAEAQRIHRSPDQFDPETRLGKVAGAVGAAKEAPGARQAVHAWGWWTDKVFRAVNGRFEGAVQTAMLGRALRDAGLKSVQDAAQGLRNTNNQIRFAREVETMYGKYNAFSPDLKDAIARYIPFAAWARNAAIFVYRTLPRDHPLATAVIAAAEQAEQDWLKAQGLNQFASGALPGFLQGSIPTAGGGHQRFPFRYTPFGLFGDVGGNAAGLVLPQGSSALKNLQGTDWKGKKLTKADGTPADTIDKFTAAGRSILEGTVPVLGVGQKVAAKGFGALNPLAPVAPKGAGSMGKAGVVHLSPQAQQALREAQAAGAVGGKPSPGELEQLRREAEYLRRTRGR